MNAIGRATLCLGLLSAGVAAQAGLENLSRIERPPLRRPLASLPMELGGWAGQRPSRSTRTSSSRSQATECLSRVYENPKYPGRRALALDQLLARRHEHAALARDLPAVARLDQGRVA